MVDKSMVPIAINKIQWGVRVEVVLESVLDWLLLR
jgi:hypothetical protein